MKVWPAIITKLDFSPIRSNSSTSAVLVAKGFSLVATRGTTKVLTDAGVKVEVVNKVTEGRPNIVDMIKNNEYFSSSLTNKYAE